MTSRGGTMETTPDAEAPPAGHRVLYIDDDPAIGRFVQRRLRRLGHSVEIASDGNGGLARLEAPAVVLHGTARALASGEAGTEAGDDQGAPSPPAYDVVALDHYMPGRDGLDVLCAIRALPDPPPVVFVTGTSESSIAVAALKAGAADYVVKDVGGGFVDLLDAAIRSSVAAVMLRRAKDAADRAVVTARDRFEALAAERQVLLREVNHRVGNSLQLVAAFLHLQSNASVSAETRAALTEANRRVLAVAQVHRRLYTSDDVKAVALDTYLTALIGDLSQSSDADAAPDQLTLTAVPLMIDADSAVTVGVIVTELVINALKYAYPDGSGPVRVRLESEAQAGTYRLIVEDDGIGRLDGAEPASGRSAAPSGIGRTIIKAMASKLNTTVCYAETGTGTRAVMSFALPEPKLAAA